MIRLSRNPLHGDFFTTKSGVYFTVIGNTHPRNKIICYPRYIPHPNGDRKLGFRTYLRLQSLNDCKDFLSRYMMQSLVHDPVFDDSLCEISTSQITDYFYPERKLERMRKTAHLDVVQRTARDCYRLIAKLSKIPPEHVGISGSTLCGLHTETSDIDIIIYGEASSRKVHSTLRRLMASDTSDFRGYTIGELRRLYYLRNRDTRYPNFRTFAATEHGKSYQGFFREREFFIRFIKTSYADHYGLRRYENLGRVEVTATVIGDDDSIFTPCNYKVAECKSRNQFGRSVKEVSSFRGRFCEQAKVGDRIRVHGKLENIVSSDEHYLRILVGNEQEDCIVRLK